MKDSFFFGFGAAIVVVLIAFSRKVKDFFKSVYGDIDKLEFAGFIFTIIFIWMIYKEGTRTVPEHVFNELYILIVSSASLTGLGLRSAFRYVRDLRRVATEEKQDEQPRIETSEIPK